MLFQLLLVSLNCLSITNFNKLPFFSIPILSARYSASSKKCVVNMIVFLYAFNFNRISQIYLLDTGSIAEVGSSRNIISELAIIAKPRDNFLLFPPLSFFDSIFEY